MAKTAKELIRSLPLIDENILNEAANQPLLYVDAARYRVACMRETYRTRAEVEAFEATQGLKVRQSESEKRTEKHIKSLVIKNPKYIELRDAAHDAEADEEFSKLLLKAFEMRKDAIRIISDAENREAGRMTAEVERAEKRRQLVREARRLEEKRSRLS